MPRQDLEIRVYNRKTGKRDKEAEKRIDKGNRDQWAAQEVAKEKRWSSKDVKEQADWSERKWRWRGLAKGWRTEAKRRSIMEDSK